MIIYLTNACDKEVAVNINIVTYMEEQGDETEINFSGEAIYVKESVHEILQKAKGNTNGYSIQ